MAHSKPATKHILLIEDTRALADMYCTALTDEGHKISICYNGAEARQFLERMPGGLDLVLLDFKLPDVDGLSLLEDIQISHPRLPVIVITGHGSINTAVDAIRRGAQDFLVKPFSIERLNDAVTETLNKPDNETVSAAIAGNTVLDDSNALHQSAAERQTDSDYFGFIGRSAIMKNLYGQIENASRSTATVFITGESGTGKEVCAEAIHKSSRRADKPFIPINCAAIPRDLMESELFGHTKGAFTGAVSDREGAARLADGGTLFLDEIAEMNPDMQTKLLRFLQNLTFKKVGGSQIETTDIRIICATNRNPLMEIQNGNFREDLFYRLHVLPVYMPPLNMRDDDIIEIARSFLQEFSNDEGKHFECFSNDMIAQLKSYSWPGNIRQLQNVVRNIVVMHDAKIVTPEMLPPDLLHNSYVPQNSSFTGPDGATTNNVFSFKKTAKESDIKPLADIEREIIEDAIKICGGNIPQAAAALGVSPSTIYRKKTGWEEQEKQDHASFDTQEITEDAL